MNSEINLHLEEKATMEQPDLSLDQFRNNVKIESEKLTGFCTIWRDVLKNDENIKEEIQGDINVAIGQAEILKKSRFGQFSGLIDQSENKSGEQEITCQDLDGYWFMVYPQVEDVYRKFGRLEKLKNNKWVEPEVKALPAKPTVLKRKPVAPLAKPAAKSGPASSSIRAHMLAAKMKMKAQLEKTQQDKEKIPSQDSATVATKENSEKVLAPITDKENKSPAPENTTAPKTTKTVVITTPSSLKNTKTSTDKISPTNKSKIPVIKASPANKENSTPLTTKVPSKKVTVIAESTTKGQLTPPTSRKSTSPECNTFEFGFFKIQTPAKKLVARKIAAPITAQVEKEENSTKGPKKLTKILTGSVLKERIRNVPMEHKDYSSLMRVTRSMKKTEEVRTLDF